MAYSIMGRHIKLFELVLGKVYAGVSSGGVDGKVLNDVWSILALHQRKLPRELPRGRLEPVRKGSESQEPGKVEGNTYSYTYSYTRISQIRERKRGKEICVYEYVYEYG